MVLATQLVLQKAFSLVSKSLAVRRVKAQASSRPFFSGFSARGQNKGGYISVRSHIYSQGCVTKVSFYPQVSSSSDSSTSSSK